LINNFYLHFFYNKSINGTIKFKKVIPKDETHYNPISTKFDYLVGERCIDTLPTPKNFLKKVLSKKRGK